jgi:hypothetical protein
MILGQLYEEYENNLKPMYFVLKFMEYSYGCIASLFGMVNIHKYATFTFEPFGT